jgi:hypothetical protein
VEQQILKVLQSALILDDSQLQTQLKSLKLSDSARLEAINSLV